MIAIQTNDTAGTSYRPPNFQNQNAIGSINQLSADRTLPTAAPNSSTYIQASSATSSLRNLSLNTQNINDAMGLVQSVDSSARLGSWYTTRNGHSSVVPAFVPNQFCGSA